MPRYTTGDVAFDLPDGWIDRTINVFYRPTGEQGQFSFVIHRETSPPDEDLETYATRQIQQLSENLAEFHLIGRLSTAVSRRLSIRLDFTWQSQDQKIRQRQYFVYANGTVLTLTASSSEVLFTALERDITDIVRTFTL